MVTTETIRVTVLVENTAGGEGLLGEHGLGFWIGAGSRRVLFDTGQGLTLESNARRLGIRLGRADAIVLSHGHHDHTGGLITVLKAAPRAKVFAHPAVFQAKYGWDDDGKIHNIGMPQSDVDKVRKQAAELVRTNQPTEIRDGLFVTGEIPRHNDFEDTGGHFFLDGQCRQADPLTDDQAVFFDTCAGTVVLLGCAHAGVVNTLQYIRQLTNDRPIHAVMGGMHLVNAPPQRIDRTVEAFRQLDIARLWPAHCTGMAPTARLWVAFPERCSPCAVGTTMQFDRPRANTN